MKKSRKMGKRTPTFEFRFVGSCPLFGYIPLSGFNPRSDLNRAREVIFKAREFWLIPLPHPYHLLGIQPQINWPPEICLPDYPSKKLRAARWIQGIYGSVIQHTIFERNFRDPSPWIQREDGRWEERFTIDLRWERAIKKTRELSIFQKVDISFVPDFAILAILAIAEAKEILSRIICYGEDESHPRMMEKVGVAQSLLSHAYLLKNEFEANEYKRKLKRRGKEPITKEMKDILNASSLEINKIYSAIKRRIGFKISVDAEIRWKRVAMTNYDLNKNEFKFVKREYLEDKDLYSFTANQERRDFYGNIFQKIILHRFHKKIGSQTLYESFRTLKSKSIKSSRNKL